MKRAIALIGFLGVGVLVASVAGSREPFTLVSREQIEKERQYESEHGLSPDEFESGLHARSLVPIIRVLAPAGNNTDIASPLRIQLKFETTPDAHILPDSFRVLYGMLKIDVTDRLRQFATISPDGVIAERATFPTGSYRFFLQIADDQGRVTEKELKFKVTR